MSSPKKSYSKNAYAEFAKGRFYGLNLSSKAPDGASLCASQDILVASWEAGGGGTIGVIRLDEIEKRNPQVTLFRGHKAAIQDLQISPFYSTIFASASDGTFR